MILYGHPADPAAFEDYSSRHVPYANEHLPNAREAKNMRVVHSLDGGPSPYYRISQISYESVADLLTAIGSRGGQSTIADLANFASGGAALLIVEDDAGDKR